MHVKCHKSKTTFIQLFNVGIKSISANFCEAVVGNETL